MELKKVLNLAMRNVIAGFPKEKSKCLAGIDIETLSRTYAESIQKDLEGPPSVAYDDERKELIEATIMCFRDLCNQVISIHEEKDDVLGTMTVAGMLELIKKSSIFLLPKPKDPDVEHERVSELFGRLHEGLDQAFEYEREDMAFSDIDDEEINIYLRELEKVMMRK